MGNREYGVKVTNKSDVEFLKALLEIHNAADISGEDTGSEELIPGCCLEYKKIVYVCVHSGGGYADGWISQYMKANMSTHKPLKLFWPFEKPDWWRETDSVSDVEQLGCTQEMKDALKELFQIKPSWAK